MGNFLEENTRMNWIGIIGDIKLAAVAGGLPSLRGSVGSGSNCSPAVPPLPWAAAAYEFTACDQDAAAEPLTPFGSRARVILICSLEPCTGAKRLVRGDCTAALVGAHPPPAGVRQMQPRDT